MPRSLLEAAAMARPIITTDTTGCREVVQHGVNGYLCKVRDVESLAAAMQAMINLTPDQRTQMGLEGHKRVSREFDEQIVIDTYVTELNRILRTRIA
jgi:glycosyltransferase involved in cell wall biosynthesis